MPSSGRLTVMDPWLASAVAVAGTLLGSAATHLFQRSHAARAERFTQAERLRRERIEAYSLFAQAATELRRSVISLWFHRSTQQDSADPGLRSTYAEADRLGAATLHARFRLELVADDPALVELAAEVFTPITALRDAADRAELTEHEEASEAALQTFVSAATRQLH